MDRRKFLSKSSAFLVGTLLGLPGFTKAFAFPEPEGDSSPHPRIALIIDDIGFSVNRAKRFLDFDVPITFSILPRLPRSHHLASMICYEGQEIMLHQPMEPYNSSLDPGPGALYVGDRTKRIVNIMQENFSAVPVAVGVNNHMGSRFTARQKEMNEVLSIIKDRGLFFVDSVTSSRSTAYKTAKSLHMPAGYRNIFLDNRVEEPAILRQLQKLKKHALKSGRAIGIGHPFPETARAIRQFINGLEGSGISFVHASQLM